MKTVGPEIQSGQVKHPNLQKMEPARMLESDQMDDRQQLSVRRKKQKTKTGLSTGRISLTSFLNTLSAMYSDRFKQLPCIWSGTFL